jgi:signal transduction histidine kinase
MRVQLAQLDNARKEFVANASHELRTPLFSIGGFLELLADEELDEETRRGFIETMQGQVRRLAKLSIDLLDLSRVDAGQLNVVREPVALGSVVRMLADEIEHLAVSSGHELAVEVEEGAWCLGDGARILQIGRALATNAITHTPAGTKVTISSRRRNDRAQLVVQDEGPGIPTSERDAVFGRFYRVEGGMASGSGLGLSIARELARLMGGDVLLESEARPTVFVVDLPGEAVPEGAAPFSRENAPRLPERVSGH